MQEIVTPIYSPGKSMMDRHTAFITNINDEVSLWRINRDLRVYGSNSIGWWVQHSHDGPFMHVGTKGHTFSDTTMEAYQRVYRNKDAILTYAAMLMGH